MTGLRKKPANTKYRLKNFKTTISLKTEIRRHSHTFEKASLLLNFKLLISYETPKGATNARTSAAVNGSSNASVAAVAEIA